jgi:hypothetical protein
MTSADLQLSPSSIMLQILIKVVMTCALATSALSKPFHVHDPLAPNPVAPFENVAIALPPPTTGKVTYRQATRDTILSRKAARVASRGRALQPRQSARVYPTCSSSDPAYIPQSGFVNFPGYSLDSASANLIVSIFGVMTLMDLFTDPSSRMVTFRRLLPRLHA